MVSSDTSFSASLYGLVDVNQDLDVCGWHRLGQRLHCRQQRRSPHRRQIEQIFTSLDARNGFFYKIVKTYAGQRCKVSPQSGFQSGLETVPLADVSERYCIS